MGRQFVIWSENIKWVDTLATRLDRTFSCGQIGFLFGPSQPRLTRWRLFFPGLYFSPRSALVLWVMRLCTTIFNGRVGTLFSFFSPVINWLHVHDGWSSFWSCSGLWAFLISFYTRFVISFPFHWGFVFNFSFLN